MTSEGLHELGCLSEGLGAEGFGVSPPHHWLHTWQCLCWAPVCFLMGSSKISWQTRAVCEL